MKTALQYNNLFAIFRTIHLLLKNEQSTKRSREEVLKLNFVLYVFFELKSLKFTVKINFLKTQDLRSKVNFTKILKRPKGTLGIILQPLGVSSVHVEYKFGYL